jgi:hypothetical protein
MQQADNVDADPAEPDAVRVQSPDGQPPQPVPLRLADFLQRRAVLGAGTGLHLTHDKEVLLHRDDAEFAFGALPVAVQNPEAAFLQVVCGGPGRQDVFRRKKARAGEVGAFRSVWRRDA